MPVAAGGFEIETDISVHALELRMPVAEVETPYFARPAGSASKLSTYSDGWRILRTIITLYRIERPLLFFGVIGAVLAEQAGASTGLGHLILVAIPELETARAYAAVVLLALLAVLLFALLTALERLLVPWARTDPQGARP